MSNRLQDGAVLRAYLAFSRIAEPLYRMMLKRRLKRNKEDPLRYREKLGYTDTPRPSGQIIWLHGVGLGEVLALRSLIMALQAKRAGLNFLVSSSTKTSASVFARNCPHNTIHQFLPVDTAGAITRFLNHWQPSISVWAEQDLWPAMVVQTHKRQIPLVLVNARMNAKSYHSRARTARLFKDLYQRFDFISAQDNKTAEHMRALGAVVTADGSLKAAAIPLADPIEARVEFEALSKARTLWLAASSHLEDERLALAAHQQFLQTDPKALLIIAPRFADRTDEIKNLCIEFNLSIGIRSSGDKLDDCQVYLADTFGEMGLWYRVCRCALIGGTHSSAIEGHNPWEAAALNCAIMFGPKTANFKSDYTSLKQHRAAHPVCNVVEIARVLQSRDTQMSLAANAMALTQQNNQHIDRMAQTIISLLDADQQNAVVYSA